MSPCQLCHPGDKCLCSVPPFSAWGRFLVPSSSLSPSWVTAGAPNCRCGLR